MTSFLSFSPGTQIFLRNAVASITKPENRSKVIAAASLIAGVGAQITRSVYQENLMEATAFAGSVAAGIITGTKPNSISIIFLSSALTGSVATSLITGDTIGSIPIVGIGYVLGTMIEDILKTSQPDQASARRLATDLMTYNNFIAAMGRTDQFMDRLYLYRAAGG